jgi:leucyl-tRNA synthetase
MEYNFRDIEKKWQQQWKASKAYEVPNDLSKPKCYVLDMFPYPSGTGLHVGHPLGYIASDIYSRYKRLKGFNVLHPMGFDSFGLPAEQYALDTGQHPAETTRKNIATFKSQLDNIAFSFDWSREVQTSDPAYYKWTQWIFLQLFKSFYDRNTNKAEPINKLVAAFEKEGNAQHAIPDAQYSITSFTAEQWKAFDKKTQQDILMQYRIAYCGYGEVNWCEALGTVLANDEVINGVSERGGYPVVKKTLRQWYLRITEYADRLLEGLEKVEFSDAMKEMQTNWIGKSSGAEIDFGVRSRESGVGSQANLVLKVYTTRPDTIFGVDFMVIAPEHELVEQITTPEQKTAVEEYITYVKSRSERERMAEKKISGVFTGAYAVNPFDGREIPVWISEYVLAGYGTGAIMAVPCGDERDHKFAKQFNIPITNIIGEYYDGENANATKDAKLEHSDFLNGIEMRKAAEIVIADLELSGRGKRKVNYKMRDAAFSRQRYWGEPFPIKWIDGIAYPLDESELPLKLPHVDSYKPGPDGEGPLANIKEWVDQKLETNTMPGYAGSSWYFLRYMDPHNDKEFCDRKISDYWNQVDIYIGGTEHAVGHLLYSRMWTKVLYDLDLIGHDEPYKKLVNQGMITGISKIVWRRKPDAELKNTKEMIESIAIDVFDDIKSLSIQKFYSLELVNKYGKEHFAYIHIPIGLVDGDKIQPEQLINQWPDRFDGVYITEKGYYYNGKWKIRNENDSFSEAGNSMDFIVESVVEKMSKSKLNVENPDDVIAKYGADTFRMYEMFLGPVEMSKPWDTKGIEGVHRFLKKFWRLFYDEIKGKVWTEEKATDAELKVLHNAIKKIESDTERFSFNTGVSGFMIATNELTDLKCHKKEILEKLLILLTPYAPHIAEELWSALGNKGGILDAVYPTFEAKYVMESSKEYPVSINGKTRTTIDIALDATQPDIEKIVLANEIVQKWIEGKPVKKFIFVKGKMINVVV